MLRDYQRAAADAALTFHKYKNEPAIIVIPTGGGKTHVIAEIARYYKEQGKRVAVIAHRKELLEQSGSKFDFDFGYYSASLGESDLESDIVIAGIQSIYNKDFEPFDVIIVDECHRIPHNTEGQYWQFIKSSPDAKIIGFTATPYRLKGGKLGWGEEIYNIPYEYLKEQGYLSKITNKVKNSPDLSKIEIIAGDYKEDTLAEYMSSPELIELAVKNIIAYGAYRYSVIIFCVNKIHCNLLHDSMKVNGLQSMVITGDSSDKDRREAITDFKEGRLRYLINCQIFTEGFDAPCTDMIVMLRPTKSKALFEQMCGRGVRIFEGKEDCFLLDMAGNLEEHDGYGNPYYEKSKKEVVPRKGRICPACEAFVQPKGKDCPECGYVFEKIESKKVDHSFCANVDDDAVFSRIKSYNVTEVLYREHRSKSGNISIRVDYVVMGYKYGVISEYLSVYHENDWVRNKAYKFYESRGHKIANDTKEYDMDALLWHAERMNKPSVIKVDHSDKFPRIVEYEWNTNKQIPQPIELEDEIKF